MKLIAHRGNTKGILKHCENSPDYLDHALSMDYDVEIDFRKFDTGLYLGHDLPEYKITDQWLQDRKNKIWLHCKNAEAFTYALDNNYHCFWHNVDDYTLTSYGFVWAFPGKSSLGPNTILVMPEHHYPFDFIHRIPCYGVCSDFVDKFKQTLL